MSWLCYDPYAAISGLRQGSRVKKHRNTVRISSDRANRTRKATIEISGKIVSLSLSWPTHWCERAEEQL